MMRRILSGKHARMGQFWLRAAGGLMLGAAVVLGGVAAASAQPGATMHDAKDIAGQWQGTLVVPQASLRLVVKFAKADKGWTAKFYSIDQKSPALETKVTFEGTTVTFTTVLAPISYTGTVSADGNTLTGTFTQGSAAIPLTLVRAGKETAWEIPAAPAPLKQMAADADPVFDVATIKPNNSGAPAMQGLAINGRDFRTRNSSAGDLIAFAYDVQLKQIVGGPDWLNKDRYDVQAVPDIDGTPSLPQLRGMVRKLLADRFKLTFHKDHREMPAFVLTVAKSGAKVKPTESNGPLPSLGIGGAKGGVKLIVGNGTIANLCELLQSVVLDRPVVNQTGLEGKYDLSVTFTPDDSQFGGHPPPVSKSEEEAAPSLFDAMQKTLGLKLEAEKVAVEVIAVDHVEKYSAN